MADNIYPEAVVSAATFQFRTDDLGGGVQAPASKILLGADGTDDGFVSSANPLPVSLASVPSHAVTNAGTFAVQAAQAGTWTVTGTGGTFPVTDSGGSLTVDAPVGTPLFVRLSDGTAAITTLPVSLASVPSHEVTLAANQTLATLTGGGVAHDGIDTGNPHKVGGRAVATLSTATLVSAGDRSDLVTATDGSLVVRPHTTLDDVVAERTTNTDGASTAFTSGLAAPGSGVRLCITAVTICNSSSTFCTVDLRDGSSGSVLWTLPVPATGGVVQRFDPPLRLTANTALAFDASAATTTLTISANGFKTKL